MQSEGPLHINLALASAKAECPTVALDDTFFSNLDQDEIVGGNVSVVLRVMPSVSQIYAVKIDIKGSVTVRCDRCLDPLPILVDIHDEVKVKDAEPDDNDPGDANYTEGPNSMYDFGWDIYEIIETSLPTKRVHASGQCNEDVARFVSGSDDDFSSENEDE